MRSRRAAPPRPPSSPATNRAGRPRAAQFRPYVRPCVRAPRPLRRRAACPRRGRRDRHGLRLAVFRAAGPLPAAGSGPGRIPSARRSACRSRSRTFRAWTRERRRHPRSDVSGQEGRARRADLHSGARHRRLFHREERRRRRRSAASCKTNCCNEELRRDTAMHGAGAEGLPVDLWLASASSSSASSSPRFSPRSETALTAASRARMHALEKKGDRRAARSTACSQDATG